MPRYFFQVFDGFHRPDPDGTVLPDARAAQVEAIILAGHLLQDYAARVLRCENWHLTVTEENGATLFRLDLAATVSQVPDFSASNIYAFRQVSS